MKRLPFIAKRNEVAIKRKLGEKKKKKTFGVACTETERKKRTNKSVVARRVLLEFVVVTFKCTDLRKRVLQFLVVL
jgi:hypothetical protein